MLPKTDTGSAKGKPGESRRRKATGLPPSYRDTTAGLPDPRRFRQPRQRSLER